MREFIAECMTYQEGTEIADRLNAKGIYSCFILGHSAWGTAFKVLNADGTVEHTVIPHGSTPDEAYIDILAQYMQFPMLERVQELLKEADDLWNECAALFGGRYVQMV